ncbi:MAG: class I SAM-dependent methyltransferase [Neisseria sp.]|uniref:class I SAM-dependent methyltransferase n=1 Tax=Neisseria sp. TaxID=192066 RepID=UPI0026DC83C8|nr:class I SAM-dependent methyltransferase [Neisseria sp.]MDO4640952.1 class I SAM-dependent methyltransferase [Neisseria sp.]
MYKWDERYATEEFIFGTEPNVLLREVLHHLPKHGRALDVATGEGRNGVFLAEQGLETTGIDLSEIGLQKARRLAQIKGVPFKAEQHDIAEYPFIPAHYAVICSIFCHFIEPLRTQICQRIVTALEPGGMFVGVFYHPEQIALGTGGPSNPAMLGTLEEMKSAFNGLEWLIAEYIRLDQTEGSRHRGESALIRLLGRKPL